jgi:plastocyanin
LGCTLAVVLALVAAGCTPTPRSVHVQIDRTGYDPAEVVAVPGDTIVWTNTDVVEHTVTAVGNSFNSGPIPPGGTWSLVVQRIGRQLYFCGLHPNASGVIVVRAPR